jgi:hypothetical protein
VNGTADAAHDLRVPGILFQAQAILVERLQEFLRALEEELFELGALFLGEEAHDYPTSIRW